MNSEFIHSFIHSVIINFFVLKKNNVNRKIYDIPKDE